MISRNIFHEQEKHPFTQSEFAEHRFTKGIGSYMLEEELYATQKLHTLGSREG